MLIGSFLLRGIKTYEGIDVLNCAEMKMLIKLYFTENSCAVKAAHETSLAITASLHVSEGKMLILSNLLLQESLDLPSVLPHCFSSFPSSSAFSRPPGGT